MGATATTIEQWAQRYIESTELAHKLAPPPPPEIFATDFKALDLRPGRPAALDVVDRAPRLRGNSTLARAKAAHTFLHHELQATELMCWCVLRFPEAPDEFRQGLIRVALDEIRHMQMYEEYIRAAGFEIGAFPVRDWFWERIPACDSPSAYVATMGLGFEGANLDHTQRFASSFAASGDASGSALQKKVGLEEIAHVRFAANWLRKFRGKDFTFSDWRALLPEPLSPILMRGKPINRKARARAGIDNDFCKELESWQSSG